VLPTARFLASIERETAHGRRVRELFLLALRALALLMLGLAFATPEWTRFTTAIPGDARTVYVLDVSASMRTIEGGQTFFERAHRHITGELSKNEARESGVVVARRSPAALLPRLSTNTRALLEELAAIGPTYEYASLREAVALAESIPDAEGRASSRQIVLVTDAARTGFEGLSAGEFDSVRIVRIVRIGADHPPVNSAVHSVLHSPARPVEGGELSISFTLANFTPEPRTIPVTLRIGSRSRTEIFEISEMSESEIELPLENLSAGEHSVELSIPGDSFAADDTAHIVVRVAPAHRVGVLTRGMSPLRGSILAAVAGSVPVPATALGEVSAMIVADPGPLSDAALGSIAEFARLGGAVLWCITGAESAELLLRVPAPAQSEALFETVEFAGGAGEPEGVRTIRPAHLFETPTSERFDAALETLRFARRSMVVPTGTSDVALRFNNGDPALARIAYADGSLTVLAIDLSDESSGLLRSPVFPLLLDAIVGAPGAGTVRRAAIVGEPDRLSSSSQDEPGVASAADSLRAWNIDSRESDPQRLDSSALLAGTPAQAAAAPVDDALRIERSVALWPWLMLASALALACESLVLGSHRTSARSAPGADTLDGGVAA